MRSIVGMDGICQNMSRKGMILAPKNPTGQTMTGEKIGSEMCVQECVQVCSLLSGLYFSCKLSSESLDTRGCVVAFGGGGSLGWEILHHHHHHHLKNSIKAILTPS